MSETRAPVVVVIPVYRAAPHALEAVSLARCRRLLGGHPVRLACPAGLDVTAYCGTWSDLAVERFDEDFFTSKHAYSSLLCGSEFYSRFADFEHLLIHQLDCYVFEDRLLEWCDAGFDYVGAPWVDFDWLSFSQRWWSRLPGLPRLLRRVGNGGLSLRRVERFEQAARRLRWLASRLDLHEDLFWSNVVPALVPGFRVAPEQEALRFAFEARPRECFDRSGGQLPFGCHGFAVHDPDFWRLHLAPEDRAVLERTSTTGG
jgi:hypothetical protein